MTVAHSQPASGTQYPGAASSNATRFGQAAKAEAKYLAGSVSKLSMLDFWAGFGLIFYWYYNSVLRHASWNCCGDGACTLQLD